MGASLSEVLHVARKVAAVLVLVATGAGVRAWRARDGAAVEPAQGDALAGALRACASAARPPATLQLPHAAVHTRALGLSLGEADADDARHWSEVHHLRCRALQPPRRLICHTHRPDGMAPPLSSAAKLQVVFSFDDRNLLNGLAVTAHYPRVEQAAASWQRLYQMTAAQLGSVEAALPADAVRLLAAGDELQALRQQFCLTNLAAHVDASATGQAFAVNLAFQLL